MTDRRAGCYNSVVLRVYLDMCCLKRPFDAPTNERVRLETEAVLVIMSAPVDAISFVHALAQDLENDQNPVVARASRVRRWLQGIPLEDLVDHDLEDRTSQLVELGLRSFDALHVASSELASADVVVTCDDRFLAVGRRSSEQLRVRVIDPITLAQELFP